MRRMQKTAAIPTLATCAPCATRSALTALLTCIGLLLHTATRTGATLVLATHDARVWQALPQAQVLVFDATAREATA